MVAVAMLLVLGVALLHVPASKPSSTARGERPGLASRRGLSSLPLAAQGQISRALGADDQVYRATGSGDGFRAASPAQGLQIHFGRSGVLVGSGKTQLGLSLRGVGYARGLRAVGAVRPSAKANRIDYIHPGLSEWYSDGPLGLEQGFTVTRAPAGDPAAPLTLSLALSGNARASLAYDGQSLALSSAVGPSLSYTGLHASDARGRALRTWLELHRGHVLLRVDSRGARYPVRIDPLIQQGSKLTAKSGEQSANGYFGYSVALSSDGNTAVIGGPYDAGRAGAAWVFTRSGSTWTQQGPKLTAKGGEESSNGYFGYSVALSADGNTAVIGGPYDTNNAGAAWVFTRSGSTWTQQGSKLTGSGESGPGYFGYSVALSSDGNTALIGAPFDNDGAGAAWAFTRSGSTWTQQGQKLTGSGESGPGYFGYSMALSSDGNTALLGGPRDNSGAGAAWAFTRSGSTWTQQGQKLTGSGESGPGYFGYTVALSADGNTAVIGGPYDTGLAGAAWAFTRSGSTWTQQGSKLTGSGESGPGYFGYSVALSADGNTALIGGSNDQGEEPAAGPGFGAAWAFTRSGSTWTQQGSKLAGSGEGGRSGFGYRVALSSDGNTALVGGPYDAGRVGAAFAFARSSSTWTQQGSKLTAGEEGPNGYFGYSMALSADGNTALIADPYDNNGTGAAWVFTRSSSTWTQQGSKLTGSGESGPGYFGSSVALSSDGNTALIGGPYDNAGAGAAWAFTRSGSTWAQQGSKLTGSGESGAGCFGYSIGLSADGNTAVIGGPYDAARAGAAWAFTRSGSTWAQQGSKLTGSGESGPGYFGYSVALSADGNTALLGGPRDNSGAGAAWPFTRSGSTWAQQGEKLTGSGASAPGYFGYSVALSADGNTALIGAPHDAGRAGAAWAFTRSASTWTQQGEKLTGSGESGPGCFGYSVALSSDGNAALIGGPCDAGRTGTAFPFGRSGSTWTQRGTKLTAKSGEGSAVSYFGFSLALSGDGRTALVGGPYDNSSAGAAWAFMTPPVPANIKPPTVIGTAKQGQTLVEEHGTWEHSPTDFAYQWLRCSLSGSECSPIGGAAGRSYLETSTDIHHTIKVQEIASNLGGSSSPAISGATAEVIALPLHAVAGESLSATSGMPVTFDGTGSTPTGEIERYRWEFGDGAGAEGESTSHVYSSAGTYTTTLTVYGGGESNSQSITVTVLPPPAKQVSVKTVDTGGQPISGATLLYIAPNGTRTEATTGSDGSALLPGLPDGNDAIYGYKAGFQPAVAQVAVTGGAGQTTVTLQSGEITATTLKSRELNLTEIEAAGINTNDPANQHVYEFEIKLAFITENETGPPTPPIHVVINSNGIPLFGPSLPGVIGPGPVCERSFCALPQIAKVTDPEGHPHPVIQWLILRGNATVLKQFFTVSMVIQNLSASPFTLTKGKAVLNIPSGLSLAPTASPQEDTQTVADIPGGGSATTNWIVRGDEPGKYNLSADYRASLLPFEAEVNTQAGLAEPLQVWGASALSLSVQADSGSLSEGVPYHVRIGITNKADVPLYNVGLAIDSSVHEHFIFQPQQRFSETLGEVPPGKTVYAKPYILVPDGPSESSFKPGLSSATFAGETVHPGAGIESVAPPRLYALQATRVTPNTLQALQASSNSVDLHWQQVEGAEGYEVFSTPTLDTPFSAAPEPVLTSAEAAQPVTLLPATATDAYIPHEKPGVWYGVSTIINGLPTLDHPLERASGDGIPNALKQQLAERYAPILLFHPKEPNYPVSVKTLLGESSLKYYENCGLGASDQNVQIAGAPLTPTSSPLLTTKLTTAACSQTGPTGAAFAPIEATQADPEAERYGGSKPKQTFYLTGGENHRLGSLNPSDWQTYFHAYPALNRAGHARGGIIIQYWHVFPYNERFEDNHEADWDASVQVELAPGLKQIERVWFSRHGDDHPGAEFVGEPRDINQFNESTDLPKQTWSYNGTHLIAIIDEGSHAAFASPQDVCHGLSILQGTPSETVFGNPAAPGRLSEVKCNPPPPPLPPVLLSLPIGGSVWDTKSNGSVTQGGLLLAHRVSGSKGGAMVNVGEYNAGTAQCGTVCAGVYAGAALPVNHSDWIEYSGLWGNPSTRLGLFAYPPRGPVFQGFDSGSFKSWFNEATQGPWQPPASGVTACGTSSQPCPAGTPTHLSISPHNGSVDVTWRAPASTPGGPITGYIVKATPIQNDRLPQPTASPKEESVGAAIRPVKGLGPLLMDCHQTYQVSVSAQTATGVGPPALSQVFRPSGLVAKGEPLYVVVLLDGVGESKPGFTMDPYSPTQTGVASYCPENIDANGNPVANDFLPTPRGPEEFFAKWNEYDPQDNGGGNVPTEQSNSTPRDLTTGVETHTFMLDQIAATGAIILPFSYEKAELKERPHADPLFTSPAYTACNSSPGIGFPGCGNDPGGSPDQPQNSNMNYSIEEDANALASEVSSIRSVWKKAKIVVVGHSQGGLVAFEAWRENKLASAYRLFSLDSPINGVCPTRINGACLEPPGYPAYDSRVSRDQGYLPKDSGRSAPFRMIGTWDDEVVISLLGVNLPAYGVEDATLQVELLQNGQPCSDLGSSPVTSGCPDSPTGPDHVSECKIPANGWIRRDQHFIVKFCPKVVDYFNETLIGAR